MILPTVTRTSVFAFALGTALLTAALPARAVGSKGYPGYGNAFPAVPLPAGGPLSASTTYVGLDFSGSSATYENADTWYPSWAADDKLYSPFTDGIVGGLFSNSCVGCGGNTIATTGNASIAGSDPLHLTVTGINVVAGSPGAYQGRYPSASLVYNGVWYYGTYLLDDLNGPCNDFCDLGPFVGFRTSTDGGVTWTDGPNSAASPLFGESGKNGGKVKLGPLHFVDFGKNMANSPDGKAYLISQGACSDSTIPSTWIAGDCIYVVRVTPGVASINAKSAYQYFAGFNGTTPIWSSNFASMQPLIKWNSHLGNVSVTYDAPLQKYLMVMSMPSDGINATGPFDAMVLESSALTGPWKVVQYLPKFGSEAYFLTIPSKFISSDGRTFWLTYSANFAGGFPLPENSTYALTLHEVTLRRPTDPQPLQLLYSPSRTDYESVGTTAGVGNALGGDYQFRRTEAYVQPSLLSGTVPLQLYFSPARNDNLLVSTAEGIASAQATGYVFVRTEGYVYSTQQSGTVPLKLYFSGAAQDNLTLATAEQEELAQTNGYSFIRVEGYALRRGPVPLQLAYSGGRQDNLTAGTVATRHDAVDAGYGFLATIGLALPYADAGLVPLELWFSGNRADNASVATAQGRADVMAAGYTRIATQGYIYPNQVAGSVPLKLYWSSARLDNDTVTSAFNAENNAVDAGYQLIRTEGYVLPNQ